MVCYCNKRELIYIHIPKTGGLTIEKILIKNYGFKYFKFEEGRYDFLSDEEGKDGFLRYILKYSKESKKYDLKSFKKFTFVRNPYTRAVSALKYLSRIYEIDLPENEILYQKLKENVYCYNHFYLSQTDCLKDDNGELNIDYIGKFENFSEDLAKILYEDLGFFQSDINRIHENMSTNEITFDEDRLKLEIRFHMRDDFLNFNYEI